MKPNELKEAYYVYHTFDPSVAIERLLEEKGISFDLKKQNERLLEMLRIYLYENNVRLEKEKQLLSKTKGKSSLYRIYYREKEIGNIEIERNARRSAQLKESFNEECPKHLEMAEVVLKKTLGQIEKDKRIHSLSITIPKEDDEHIRMIKGLGFQYKDESEHLALFSKEL